MDYIYIGKIVNTHGIKGEVRLLSDFNFKKDVFKKDVDIYIGKEKEKMKIQSHRPHKNFDMIKFYDIVNINEVLKYKGKNAYVLKTDLNVDGYLHEDIIGLDAYFKDVKIGTVESIIKSKAHEIFVLGKTMIPNNENFVQTIDLKENKIVFKNVEGLINED